MIIFSLDYWTMIARVFVCIGNILNVLKLKNIRNQLYDLVDTIFNAHK